MVSKKDASVSLSSYSDKPNKAGKGLAIKAQLKPWKAALI